MLQEIDGFRAEVVNLQRDLQALTEKYKRAQLLGGTDEEAVRNKSPSNVIIYALSYQLLPFR